jgi:prepilin-type N-terminal cleavage/methylation domain-containing protein
MNNSKKNRFRCVLNEAPGFTLIEVMMALTIFAVGVSAVLTMLIHVNRNGRLSDDTTRACFLAQRKMEELIGLDFTDSLLGATREADGFKREEPYVETENKYTIAWDVRDMSPTAKKLSLVVRWNAGFAKNGRTLEYHLTSIAPKDSL